MNLNLLSADRARCNGNGESCCDTCARRLQIPLDGGDGFFPCVEPIAESGNCAFKIDLPKWFA